MEIIVLGVFHLLLLLGRNVHTHTHTHTAEHITQSVIESSLQASDDTTCCILASLHGVSVSNNIFVTDVCLFRVVESSQKDFYKEPQFVK